MSAIVDCPGCGPIHCEDVRTGERWLDEHYCPERDARAKSQAPRRNPEFNRELWP